jgi:hypothetical protein
MMLPSAESIGAENHARKPNGIPLDSVSPENALEPRRDDGNINVALTHKPLSAVINLQFELNNLARLGRLGLPLRGPSAMQSDSSKL